ncbi:unnamed protein product [Protopolystoma xenopodis]|uniref:Fibronectin type-III domain-containing protein n=1 Tax=Protopolystoma xenopodis TaxID=117903 RepID=A0A448X2E7_9PLAT|nr:unnamed protein product [Protopolystoma xenopodis]
MWVIIYLHGEKEPQPIIRRIINTLLSLSYLCHSSIFVRLANAGKVTNLTAVSTTSTSLLLSWTPPALPSGSTKLRFVFTVSPAPTSAFVRGISVYTPTTYYAVVGLVSCQLYEFTMTVYTAELNQPGSLARLSNQKTSELINVSASLFIWLFL